MAHFWVYRCGWAPSFTGVRVRGSGGVLAAEVGCFWAGSWSAHKGLRYECRRPLLLRGDLGLWVRHTPA